MHPFIKTAVKKAKLAYLWVVRILFAPNHFGASIFTRLHLAICGGYMVDQSTIYDFKHNDRYEYLSEFDWYRSRWINQPFDQMLNNKIICTEVLAQYTYVPRIFLMKNKGRMVSPSKSRRRTPLPLPAAKGFMNKDVCVLSKSQTSSFVRYPSASSLIRETIRPLFFIRKILGT